MLILNKNDIIQHVDLNKNLIPIIEDAFNSLSKGLVMMPPIMRIDIEKCLWGSIKNCFSKFG